MTVKEYALRMLPPFLRGDPWVQAVMLSAGETLDRLAERIVAIYNADNFDALNLAQVRRYECLLGIVPDDRIPITERRSALMAAWNVANKPSLALIQLVCDGWQNGGVAVSYGSGTIKLSFMGEVGVPANISTLKRAIAAAAPAHLAIDYAYKYLLISDVEAMTLAELEGKPLNQFAGGA